MTDSTTFAFRTAALVAILLAALAAAYVLGNQRRAPSTLESVTIAGSGEVTVVPDQASVSLGVQVERKDAREAMDEASTLQAKLIAALEREGVDKADIRTSGISLRPHYDYVQHRGEVLRGYTVTQKVKVTIKDLTKAGDVLSAAADAAGDAGRIDGFKLVASDRDKGVREARKEAIEDARATAEQFAEAAGRKLGKALIIKETASRTERPVDYDLADGLLTASLAVKSAPVEPGTQKSSVQVKVVWALD